MSEEDNGNMDVISKLRAECEEWKARYEKDHASIDQISAKLTALAADYDQLTKHVDFQCMKLEHYEQMIKLILESFANSKSH